MWNRFNLCLRGYNITSSGEKIYINEGRQCPGLIFWKPYVWLVVVKKVHSVSSLVLVIISAMFSSPCWCHVHRPVLVCSNSIHIHLFRFYYKFILEFWICRLRLERNVLLNTLNPKCAKKNLFRHFVSLKTPIPKPWLAGISWIFCQM